MPITFARATPPGIILQFHSNAVRFLDHVTVCHNVALGIHNHARAEGTLADRSWARACAGTALATRSALSTEKAVKEVVKRITIIGHWGRPRRRFGALIVDSVLILTTLGSSCFEIWENWLDSCCGEGTVNGVASEVTVFFSCPLTLYEITVPMRIPTVKVSRIESVYAGRFAFSCVQIARAR